MLDLHCHILPGIDDGAANLDEALAMARFCVADGITHITATPHCNRIWPHYRDDILRYVADFNAALQKAAIPLTVLPGSEIQVSTTANYRRDFEAGRLCHLGDSRSFTLLEFSWNAKDYPSDAVDLIDWLHAQGMTPIIAHPERHPFFHEVNGRLPALVEAGAWLQITVDSLLDNHGASPRKYAEKYLRLYPDCVLATDAHNMRRCSGLAAGYRWVAENLRTQRAIELRENAERVLAAIGGA